MKVTATKPGYFGRLRAAGDTFEVPDDTTPASWFEPVEKPAEKPAEKPSSKGKGGKPDPQA